LEIISFFWGGENSLISSGSYGEGKIFKKELPKCFHQKHIPQNNIKLTHQKVETFPISLLVRERDEYVL
jgi:hypothetical protein